MYGGTLLEHRHRVYICDYNTKRNFKQIGYESMDWIALVQYRVQWWASSQPLNTLRTGGVI